MRTLPIALSSLILLCGQAIGQNKLDVSQCFNGLLQQRRDTSSLTRIKLALLAQTSETSCEERKQSGALDIIGYGSGSFEDFSKKRREYFSSLNIDFDYYQSISLSSITLDKPAYDTINKCIEQVANPSDNYGLHFLSSVDNDTAASIRFFWRPLHDDKLQVLDSTITNAEVVGGRVADQEVPAGKLFPKPGWYDPFHPYAEINASGPTIQLKRINKAEPITINVTTRPQVGTAPIVIQPPEKEPTIQTFFYRETVTRTYPKSQIITPEKGPDGNIYRISDHVPGSIVSLGCTYRGHTHHHQTSCGPVANRASDFKCEGFTNDGNNWPLNVTVVYLAAFLKCAENCGSAVASSVKPLPSDSPESYSYDSGFQLKGFENDTCSWSAQKH